MDSISYILKGIRPDLDFSQELNLIDESVLDSLDLIRLVHELEVYFKINIEFNDIIPENFNSVEAIEHLVKKTR
jgi:acyl carrier protein